jgi:uncharacterized SAM-binding protein YcdF (DUF218 family)
VSAEAQGVAIIARTFRAGQNVGMQLTLLSSGKALTDPLFVLLLLGLVSSLVTAIRARRDRRVRGFAILSFASVFLIAIAALPLTALLLNRLLRPVRVDSGRPPQFIVAPSGGYTRAATSSYGILTGDSGIRTIAAIDWWHETRGAKLVFTGGDTTVRGTTIPVAVRLMRDEAMRRGVPASAIIIESRSRNTREHGVELARVIPRDASVGLVTSGWHLRRATRVFKRHFPALTTRAADHDWAEPLAMNHFIPSASAMRMTTVLSHEYVGMAWYALRP